MKLEITPAEAWEAVERLKITVNPNACEFGLWCASIVEPKTLLGWGPTALLAVGALLERLAAAKVMEKPGIQNGLAQLEEMETVGQGSIGR